MEPIKVQCCVRSNSSDEYLKFLRQMNIENCYLMFDDEHSNYDDVNRTLDRVRKAGLTVNDAGNDHIYKHPSIHLGWKDRDYWIDKYNDLNRILGHAGVPVGYMTWDTGRVSTTRWAVGEHTCGSVARIVDMNEILARGPAFDREYEEDELWRITSTSWSARFRLRRGQHQDRAASERPRPRPKYEGCASLIYKRRMLPQGHPSGEQQPLRRPQVLHRLLARGGDAFGNVLENLDEFIRQDRVFIIHFRNVSATLPYFEETLLEKGYMDMDRVMKQIVKSGYRGAIHADHVPRYPRRSAASSAPSPIRPAT